MQAIAQRTEGGDEEEKKTCWNTSYKQEVGIPWVGGGSKYDR